MAPDDPVRNEVIGEAGLFFSQSEPESYARALAQAAERDWGDLPRQRAARFPFSKTCDAYARLFHELAR